MSERLRGVGFVNKFMENEGTVEIEEVLAEEVAEVCFLVAEELDLIPKLEFVLIFDLIGEESHSGLDLIEGESLELDFVGGDLYPELNLIGEDSDLELDFELDLVGGKQSFVSEFNIGIGSFVVGELTLLEMRDFETVLVGGETDLVGDLLEGEADLDEEESVATDGEDSSHSSAGM